jgi:Gram-negative bacterial TonB protein C-terminal
MAEAAGHGQATVLETPVTIQGAKHVDAAAQRELFTETTKTTIVFDNGAVVNLNSKVAQGQCIFLRNDLTGKEVLCKVLEWRQVAESGYADLEFTTREPHFWDAPAEPLAASAPVVPAASVTPAPLQSVVTAPEPAVADPEPAFIAPELAAMTEGMGPNLVIGRVKESELSANDEYPATYAESLLPAPASSAAETSEQSPEVENDPHDETDEQADWDESKDAEMLSALLASDSKRKPKRESAAAKTEDTDAEVAALSEGAEQFESSADTIADVKEISAHRSWLSGLHKFTYGKNAVIAGIAASLLIVTLVGVTWHTVRKHSMQRSNRAFAAPVKATQHAQPAVAQASPTPSSQAPVSAVAASGPATAAATSSNSAGNTANAAATSASSTSKATSAPAAGSNSGATPVQAVQQIPQPATSQGPTIVTAKNSAADAGPKVEASDNNADAEPDGSEQPKHHSSKTANSGETIPAKIVSQTPPAIPSWAKGLDTDGVVKLDAVIDEKGNLKATKPLSGPRVLQHEAERAVALWIFEPAMTDGKPTTTHMVLTVQFQR